MKAEKNLVQNENELYKKLSVIFKNKELWLESIPFVSKLILQNADFTTDKLKAKALWILGEIGLCYPEKIGHLICNIVSYLHDENPLLRQRACTALGRIGRADFKLIEEFFEELFLLQNDESPEVRLAFIWASENIATNYPELFYDRMSVFEKFFSDTDIKVRIESPEIFRVVGKRKPLYVEPYIDKLLYLSTHDENRVVRIHAQGAMI